MNVVNISRNINFTICLSNGYYGGDDSCAKNDTKYHIPFLEDLFSKYPPNSEILYSMLLIPACDELIKLIPDNILNNMAYINAIIETRFRFSDYLDLCTSDKEIAFINMFFDKIKMTDTVFKKIIGCHCSKLHLKLEGIIDKTSVKLTDDHLDEACKALPVSKKSIISLISRGLSLNSNHLETACKSADAESLNYIINTGKLTVSQKHFNEVITSKRYEISTNEYESRKIPGRIKIKDNLYIYQVDAYDDKKINVLITNGYIITYDDVLFSIKYKKELPSLDKFNIILDKKVLDMCLGLNFYPLSYKFECISQNQLHFQQLCGTRRLSEIKKIMKSDSKLIIDDKCMENSCLYASNPVYNYLKSKGGVPTVKCIENVATMVKNNNLLLQVISDFNIEVQKYKDRIAELEKLLKADDKSEKPKEEIKKIDIKPKKSVIVKNKNIIIEEDSEDSEDEDLEEKEIVKKETITELHISQDKINEIQKNHRNKKLPTEKMKKILKINPKTKVAYSDIRNIIIQKIKDEDWLDKDNKSIIHIPENIIKLLALKNKDNNIQFSDIDKLVCLFY